MKTAFRRTLKPTGLIDGSNRLFSVPLPSFALGSEMVFKNGILQEHGRSNDYSLNYSDRTLTVIFATAPVIEPCIDKIAFSCEIVIELAQKSSSPH